MKRILLSAIAALSLAACGHTSASPVASAEASTAAAASRTAFPMTATLGDVHAGAATSPASGLWTEIELKYEVPCTVKLETFNYDLRARADGGTDLLVSAIGTRTVQPGTLSCQSIALVTKKVTVPGILTADSVHLVNLRGGEATLPATTKSLATIGLEIVGVRSLCPAGAECVVGGTVVTLKTTQGVSCVDGIGPVTFAVDQSDASGKVKLAVSAVEQIDSRLVACAAFPKTVDVSLPMVFASQDDLELTVLGGN